MTEIAYTAYLLLSVSLTIWVAHALSSSGEMFLIRCFGQDEELARSTNRLLVIGFYLINFGFICVRLDGWEPGFDPIPAVGTRVGATLLVLGGMHFFNMVMIARFGRVVNEWVQERIERETDLAARETANLR